MCNTLLKISRNVLIKQVTNSQTTEIVTSITEKSHKFDGCLKISI